MLEFERTFD